MNVTANKALDSGWALVAGIAFSALFTGFIWYSGTIWPTPAPYLPERPGFWYEWQLAEPTFWTRATAWGGYLAHQFMLWWLIWHARHRQPGYTHGLHPVNVWALGGNALFIGLHWLQTRLWYDGLAQDVHEVTSFASVAVMLVVILIMENHRRGLFFGRKVSLVSAAGEVARKYHGYYFAWAIVYTFWYHPMENTSGHMIGFFYMFLLLLQGSLFFTRAHTNRYWTLALEMMVIVHAVLVGMMNSTRWENFVTGLLGLFVITQIYGLPWTRAVRLAVTVAYLLSVVLIYHYGRGLIYIWEVFMIPVWDFAAVFLFSLLIIGGARLVQARS
ncbi:MAG: hypothetical protein JNJ67_00340 [Chromatiales bacterium]|nr:hypothetical protein [Chromatiales bacterium]